MTTAAPGSAVLIVIRAPFPFGGAATSRVRSFAKGLHLAGSRVEVLAHGTAEQNAATTLDWEGIRCHLVAVPSASGDLSRLGQLRHFATLNRALHARLAELLRDGSYRAVLNYNQQSSVALPVYLRCRQRQVAFFQQFAERHPPEHFRQGRASPFFWDEELAFRWAPRLAAGAVVISTYLERLCSQNGARSVLRIPALRSTTERGLPRAADATPESPLRVGYLGEGHRRDLIPVMLEAVCECRARGLDVRLRFVGLSERRRLELTDDARRRGLETAVVVDGFVPYADVERHLAESDVLLMLREATDEGQAAFPTRLPEFLLAAKPVIASAVSDLELHLRDREEIVYVRSERPSNLADQLEWLYRDRSRLTRIGSAAREACVREFDYAKWGVVLREFIQRNSADRESERS